MLEKIINLDINSLEKLKVVQIDASFFTEDVLKVLEENADFVDADETLGETIISVGTLMEISECNGDEYHLLHDKLIEEFNYLMITKV